MLKPGKNFDMLATVVMETSVDSIIVSDADGIIIEFNSAAERTFGWSRSEILGLSMDDTIIPNHHRSAHRTGMARYVSGARPRVIGRRVELEAQRRDGTIFPVELSIGETIQDGGQIFVGYIRDLSEAKAIEQERRGLERQLLAFFDNAPADMYLKRIDGPVVYCGPRLARTVGRSAMEMVGLTERQFLEPVMLANIESLDAKILEEARPIAFEMYSELLGKHVYTTRFPIKNEAGAITHIGGMIIDIDERVRAEQERQDAEARLRSFLDNAPVAMTMFDLAGKIVLMNGSAAGFYGKSANQLSGPDQDEILAAWPELKTSVRTAIGEVLETKTSRVIQTQAFSQPEQRYLDVLVSLFPLLDSKGDVSLIGSVIIDITHIQDAEREVRRSQDALHQSEKLAALGQLLAGVAHELNNPLAIVLGRASILQEKLADTAHAASLAKLRDAADRCARIVRTFLAMARQSGPRRETVQLNDLVEGALDMTAYGLRNASVVLTQDLDPELPEFDADGDQLIQVLINLIINAQHALEGLDSNRALLVRTKYDKKAELIVIEVMDNGPGVADAVAARIFEPFFTTKEVGQGTGLGLSLCRGLIEAHGGKLTLHKSENGGATFRAAFPVVPLNASPSDDFQEKANLDHQGRRALIIDDEPEIAAILADCLAPLGIRCEIAIDGNSAFELARNGKFDIVFCDVRMPGVDGPAFLKNLQAHGLALAEKLIFVSGDVLHRDVALLRATGNRLIIEKPFDPRQVRETTLRLLSEGEFS